MARINIEDSIYKDERFHKLSAFEGKFKALGLCIAAWDLAHQWYLKHPENLIPFAEWDKETEFQLLEKYGLAERKENGIYVKGSKDQCDYLKKRSEAGKAGALITNEILHGKPRQPRQITPSFSFSFSKKENKTIDFVKTEIKKNKKLREGYDHHDFNWEELYQIYPLKKGKSEGIKRLKNQIHSDDDFLLFKKSVERYTSHVMHTNTESKYIKHFSSFVGTKDSQPWRDWIDDDAGTSITGKSMILTDEEYRRVAFGGHDDE